MSTICLLLTASIDPKGSAFTKRSDPKIRERDYIEALGFYLEKGNYPVVFCENSGYDLSAVRSLLSQALVPVEALQFNGQTAPPERRKGYGELLIIRHALSHSKLVSLSDYVVKITGRYRVENLNEVLKPLKGRDDVFVLSDYKFGDHSTYSTLFVCKPEFITDYLAPFQEWLDDSKGATFERALSSAIARAGADGKVCLQFPVKPVVSGVSGTWDIKVSSRDYKNLVLSWPRIRSMARHRWGSVKRRLGIS